jgi:hypothetical protein
MNSVIKIGRIFLPIAFLFWTNLVTKQACGQNVDPFGRSYADPGTSPYPTQSNWQQVNNLAVMFTLYAPHAENISFAPRVPESWDQPTVWMSVESALQQCKESTVGTNIVAEYTISHDVTFVSFPQYIVNLPVATRGRVVHIKNEADSDLTIQYQGTNVSIITGLDHGSFIAMDISGWRRFI